MEYKDRLAPQGLKSATARLQNPAAKPIANTSAKTGSQHLLELLEVLNTQDST